MSILEFGTERRGWEGLRDRCGHADEAFIRTAGRCCARGWVVLDVADGLDAKSKSRQLSARQRSWLSYQQICPKS